MRITIVTPTYNEVENIPSFIERLERASEAFSQHTTNILVVDDNSPDGTGERVKDLQNRYANLFLLSGEKRGLGQAYLRGMDYALAKLKPDLLFEIDADFQHDPDAIGAFVEKLEEGFDFVIGSRYIPGGSIPPNWGWLRKLLSTIGNLVVRTIIGNWKIHDWTSGYRAIRTEVYERRGEDLRTFNGYTFQVAFLA